jgi:hypothetical protein
MIAHYAHHNYTTGKKEALERVATLVFDIVK